MVEDDRRLKVKAALSLGYLAVNLGVDSDFDYAMNSDSKVEAIVRWAFNRAVTAGRQSESVRRPLSAHDSILLLIGGPKTGTAFHMDRASALNSLLQI